MLDEAEYERVFRIFRECVEASKKVPAGSLSQALQPVLDEYQRLTGAALLNANEVLNHRISQYGSICRFCGKPLRTPKASYCAACGAPHGSQGLQAD
jgi:hypothetical protein